jgi:hypothetical protein
MLMKDPLSALQHISKDLLVTTVCPRAYAREYMRVKQGS